MVSTTHISATDTTKDTPPNTDRVFTPTALSSKVSAAIGKKNAFSKLPPMNPGKALDSFGIFPADGDPTCVNKPKTGTKKQDNRLLKANKPDPGCPASTLASLSVISVLDHVTSGLSETKVKAIEEMYKTELGKHARATKNLPSNIGTASILRGVSSVNQALSNVGTTVKNKTHLMSLLNCKNSSGLNGNESSLIQNLVVSSLLTQALCMSVNKLLATIGELSAAGVAMSGDLINGAISSFDVHKAGAAFPKMEFLSKLPSVLPNMTGLDNAISSSGLGNLMDGIRDSLPSGKSITKEFSSLTAGLSVVDSNWAKDSKGLPNLSLTKGNGYMATLSKLTLKSGVLSKVGINIDPTKPLPKLGNNTALLMLAANSVKKQYVSGKQIKLGKYSMVL